MKEEREMSIEVDVEAVTHPSFVAFASLENRFPAPTSKLLVLPVAYLSPLVLGQHHQ